MMILGATGINGLTSYHVNPFTLELLDSYVYLSTKKFKG